MCVGDVRQPPLRPAARSKVPLRLLDDCQYGLPPTAKRDCVTYDGPQS